MVEKELLALAAKAVQMYSESHPRPVQVTQQQAAEMLGISRHTVAKLIRSGAIRLNKFGYIPINEIDKAISAPN
jgi:DNA-binding transcriptional regulator LsrR (DeoR family)